MKTTEKHKQTFLIAASFEDRCLGLITSLGHDRQESNFVLIDFAGYENVAMYQTNLHKLKTLVAEGDHTTAKCRLNRPISGVGEVMGLLSTRYADTDITVDMSVLPRPYLFLVLNNLCLGLSKVSLAYTRAKSFGKRLSRGYASCGPLPFFEGQMSTDRNTLLILLLGFEGIKAEYLWERYTPHKTLALIGGIANEREWEVEARERNKYLLAYDGVQSATISSLDVRSIMNDLIHYCKEYEEEYNIVISPMGTKPQAIATFLVARLFKRVQIAYVPSARYFTNEFSHGVGEQLHLSLEELQKYSETIRAG